MKIAVLLKQTFDTEEKISIQDGKIVDDGVERIINPYDEYAVEESIRLKEQLGADVTVVTLGVDHVESSLRTALAMGADQALLIEQDRELDEFMAAKVIAAAIRDESFDLILAGNMSVDSGAGQVALRVAEQLAIPHVASITKLTLEGTKVTAERDVEGDVEIVEASLPVLLTAQQGLNEPRYPSLPGIMKAKKKPIKRISIDELSLDNEDLVLRTKVTELYLPVKKQSGKVLDGEVSQQVHQLISLLRNESKVI